MIYQYAPVMYEISEIFHTSSSYINKEGKHPPVYGNIDPHKIKIRGEELADDEWKLNIEDPKILEKMTEQIATMQIYDNGVYLLH